MRTPWLVLLCKFSDHSEEPQPADFFRRYMGDAGRGQGGAFDFFWDQSYGNADMTGTTVLGWLTMSHTRAEDLALSRFDRIMRGVDAARGGVDFNQFYGIIVMLNAQVDSGSVGRVALTFDGRTKEYGLSVLDPLAWTASWAGHEMGHGYGLEHSWAAGAPDVEYGDPWDIMSAFTFGGQLATFRGPNFGDSGPGLIGPYREKMGWLSSDRIYWHNQLGDGDNPTVPLAVLQEAGSPDRLMLKVYREAADPYHYWTAEYRRRIGWDRGLRDDRVVVHELRPNGLAYFVISLGNGETFDAGNANLRLRASTLGEHRCLVSVERPGAREFYYDSPGATLEPGGSVQWTWWFGTSPTLVTVIAIPHTSNVPLVCGELRSQRNADGTVTYFIDVTNTGTERASYHLSAKLTR